MQLALACYDEQKEEPLLNRKQHGQQRRMRPHRSLPQPEVIQHCAVLNGGACCRVQLSKEQCCAKTQSKQETVKQKRQCKSKGGAVMKCKCWVRNIRRLGSLRFEALGAPRCGAAPPLHVIPPAPEAK